MENHLPHKIRSQFPALCAQNGKAAPIFFDGVGGTQVPETVVQEVGNYLLYSNGNKGGVFRISRATDALMDETREILASFINAPSSEEIVFGANFTSITFQVSRTLAKTWLPGDEIIVTKLDHDANVSPWLRAAEDANIKVHFLDIIDGDCTLRFDQLSELVNERTRLIAVCAASSSVGTAVDIQAVTRVARQYNALVYVDAVAYAPHRIIDVQLWDADFVAFSAYKFFGPHIGVLWARKELLTSLPVYKIRPAPETLPSRWMNGAQPYELIAGLRACLRYIESLSAHSQSKDIEAGQATTLRQRFCLAMEEIHQHETTLTWKLIQELQKRPHFTIWGSVDPMLKMTRIPVVALSLGTEQSNDIAEFLAQRNIYIWSRSVYSLSLSERLGLETIGGFLRVGFVHYNTEKEVDALLHSLDDYVETLSAKSFFIPSPLLEAPLNHSVL